MLDEARDFILVYRTDWPLFEEKHEPSTKILARHKRIDHCLLKREPLYSYAERIDHCSKRSTSLLLKYSHVPYRLTTIRREWRAFYKRQSSTRQRHVKEHHCWMKREPLYSYAETDWPLFEEKHEPSTEILARHKRIDHCLLKREPLYSYTERIDHCSKRHTSNLLHQNSHDKIRNYKQRSTIHKTTL